MSCLASQNIGVTTYLRELTGFQAFMHTRAIAQCPAFSSNVMFWSSLGLVIQSTSEMVLQSSLQKMKAYSDFTLSIIEVAFKRSSLDVVLQSTPAMLLQSTLQRVQAYTLRRT